MKTVLVRVLVAAGMAALCPSLSVSAQRADVQAPDWYDFQSRRLHYPKEEWFTGFVSDMLRAGETVVQATERLKREAQAEAASSIRMRVEKTLSSVSSSEQTQSAGVFDERVVEVFESATRMEVSVELPGLRTEAWYNPAGGEIAAFAFVRRSELLRKLDRQITAGLTQQEMAVERIRSLAETGHKSEARQETERALQTFASVEQAQMLLLAVGSEPEDLQLAETAALRQTLTGWQSALEHGITVCLRMEATWKQQPYDYPAKRIQGELSESGCNFTADSIGADWIIDIVAVPRHYQCTTFGTTCVYTSYVDTHVSIVQAHTSQCIYQDVLTAKGTHTLGFDEAVRAAYEESVSRTGEIIKQHITQ